MMTIKVTAMAGISLECERKLSAHWHCIRWKNGNILTHAMPVGTSQPLILAVFVKFVVKIQRPILT